MKPYPSPRTVRLYMALTSGAARAFILGLAATLTAFMLAV
jgi:hypothetical protein